MVTARERCHLQQARANAKAQALGGRPAPRCPKSIHAAADGRPSERLRPIQRRCATERHSHAPAPPETARLSPRELRADCFPLRPFANPEQESDRRNIRRPTQPEIRVTGSVACSGGDFCIGRAASSESASIEAWLCDNRNSSVQQVESSFVFAQVRLAQVARMAPLDPNAALERLSALLFSCAHAAGRARGGPPTSVARLKLVDG